MTILLTPEISWKQQKYCILSVNVVIFMLLTFVADAEITLNEIKGAKRTSKFHPRLAPPLKIAPRPPL